MSVHSRGIKPTLTPDSEALTKIPNAPKGLAPLAQDEWRRIMPQLIARRIITAADLSGVKCYCTAAGKVAQIDNLLQQEEIPDLKLGGLQIRYMQAVRQFGAEFGLTPTSRARLGAVEKDDDDDDNPLSL